MGSYRSDTGKGSNLIASRPHIFAPRANMNIPSTGHHHLQQNSNLSAASDISLKNDEFSELMLPHPTSHPVTSYGPTINDLESIDTSDLIKPEKETCGNMLSNSAESIILKKDMIDGQLGFSTNLSSDEIISKFADCILELDDTDNTYSLRGYVPQQQQQQQHQQQPHHPHEQQSQPLLPHSQPQTTSLQGSSMEGMVPTTGHTESHAQEQMGLPDTQDSKHFPSTMTSAASVNPSNQINNNINNSNNIMPHHETHTVGMAPNQFYNTNNPMGFNPYAHSATGDYPVPPSCGADGGALNNGVQPQPLFVNTINTVGTRLSTSDSGLYSPKNIFAHGKMYSPKPVVLGSSASMSSTQSTRRVSLEPCDIFRSIIESNVPIVPDTTTMPVPPVLPAIPEDSNEKENVNTSVALSEAKKEENIAASSTTTTATSSDDVKTETTAGESAPQPAVLPRLPRLRNWREAIKRHCSPVTHSVSSQDLDASLQKVIREPSYKDLIEKVGDILQPKMISPGKWSLHIDFTHLCFLGQNSLF